MIDVDFGPNPGPSPAREAAPAPDAYWHPRIPKPKLGVPSLHTLYSLAVTLALLGQSLGWHLPTPAPAPAPTPAPAPAPHPTPLSTADAAGRAYGKALGPAWAKGVRAAASAVAAGASVSDAQRAADGAFLAARQAAFAQLVTPVWSAVLPEGAEPDATQRAAFAKTLNDTATGAEAK